MTLATVDDQWEEMPIQPGFALPDTAETKSQLEAITAFQKACRRHMVKGSDYGVIPGTKQPTLLKPGAEKLVRLLGLGDEYAVQSTEDWEKPFFHYRVTCSLKHLASGQVVATGLGECNSLEAKYRWRQAKRRCPECGAETIIKGKAEYGGGWLCFQRMGGCGAKWSDGAEEIEGQTVGRVENDDIYSQVNTILKMAKKRAMVDAALSAGRLSDIFTQDLEDESDKPMGTSHQDRPSVVKTAPAKGASESVRSQQRGKPGKCERHGRPFALTPEGRIGHPLGENQWCWKDEQEGEVIGPSRAEANGAPASSSAQSDDPNDLESLKVHLESLDWDWDSFESQVLKMSWTQFQALGGNPATALKRFQNYQKFQQEAANDHGQ